jgi:hypothetical protein
MKCKICKREFSENELVNGICSICRGKIRFIQNDETD